jgi:acetyl-CoA carboxylase biotin carboxyl carrier protein
VSLRYEDVAEILKIIDSSSCDEFIVETGDIKLVVRRNTAPGHVAPAAERAGSAPAIAAPPGPSPHATTARQATSGQTAATGQIEVTAPMVGTFYRAPNPDAPSFVEIGTVVQPGQPLCIIEVMKMMNSVPAGMAGTITEICHSNGELVEYGAPLFRIAPTG